LILLTGQRLSPVTLDRIEVSNCAPAEYFPENRQSYIQASSNRFENNFPQDSLPHYRNNPCSFCFFF
jgi:hypothetical protein